MEGLVFLDFDGVICDSILETLVSSWKGYYLMRDEEQPRAMPVTYLQQFKKLRPYVRAGEDFMLIHELIAGKIPIDSQQDFDDRLAERSEGRLNRYRESFYAARRAILANDREYWIGLNKLYPHVAQCLIDWASSSSLYILSTKRTEFIVEILTAKGIPLDQSRVLSCEAREKKDTILRTLASLGRERALFVDDQIDHLASNSARDPRITGCLASWGYVQQQWLEDPAGVEVLYPNQFADRVRPWLER
jgi:phosphoglycolate phosphatase-like HAD superfamily hydrolase